MGNTAIEWATKGWPVVVGCSPASPGCLHCYAARLASGRLAHLPRYADLAKDGRWTGEVRFNPKALDEPLHWRKPQPRVFVAQMGDLFHKAVSDEQIAAVFGVMAACPSHTFLVLTKRAERMRAWFEWAEEQTYGDKYPGQQGSPLQAMARALSEHDGPLPGLDGEGDEGDALERALDVNWPLPNVMLGVTAEDQQRAEERVPLLLATPAARRFVSVEPMLEAMDLRRWLQDDDVGFCNACCRTDRLGDDGGCRHCGDQRTRDGRSLLSWIIVGGESGPGAQECNVKWIRGICAQCREAGVPLFVKQLGANVITRNDDGLSGCDSGDWQLDDPDRQVEENLSGHRDGYQGAPVRVHLRDRAGRDPSEWPEALRVRQWPEVDHA